MSSNLSPIMGPPPDKADQFYDARMKINRARRHIAELQAVVSDHIRANPIKYEVVDRTIHSDTEASINLSMVWPASPEYASVVLGDFIHNLRASLDLMASALARSNKKSDSGVYFPFSDSPDGLDEMIGRKNFHRCGDDAVALLKSFNPYRGGNTDLRAIHDLDVHDKHRSLVPEVGAHIRVAIDWRIGGPPPGSEYDDLFSFPKETVLADRELISTCEDLVSMCESILEAFAALELSHD